uniref:Uncharacterized protein n=1 Tax=viral metagenome TaxID=1070528 RepID=A0A6M3JDT4_9ZZZZ
MKSLTDLLQMHRVRLWAYRQRVFRELRRQTDRRLAERTDIQLFRVQHCHGKPDMQENAHQEREVDLGSV